MVGDVVIGVPTQDRVENPQFATRGTFLSLWWRDIADGLISGKGEPKLHPQPIPSTHSEYYLSDFWYENPDQNTVHNARNANLE